MKAVLRAIRGATTVDQDSADEVFSRTQALVRALIAENGLQAEDIVSVIFTVTSDIVSAFPATAARALGLDDVALLGAVEAAVAGSLPLCIRVLVHCYSERARAELRHVYLEGAVVLRPDTFAAVSPPGAAAPAGTAAPGGAAAPSSAVHLPSMRGPGTHPRDVQGPGLEALGIEAR